MSIHNQELCHLVWEIQKTTLLENKSARGCSARSCIGRSVVSGIENMDPSIIRTTPMSIEIWAKDRFVPIIPKNKLSTRKFSSFIKMNCYQTEALIIIYEDNKKAIKKNHLLGYFKITGLIAAPPKGILRIHVCIDIDALNALKVLTRLPSMIFLILCSSYGSMDAKRWW